MTYVCYQFRHTCFLHEFEAPRVDVTKESMQFQVRQSSHHINSLTCCYEEACRSMAGAEAMALTVRCRSNRRSTCKQLSVPQWVVGVMVPGRRSTSIGPEMGEGNAGICEYVSKMGDDNKESGQKDSAKVILTRTTLALNMQAACLGNVAGKGVRWWSRGLLVR